ncbi:MAG: 3-oxoacyl-ACP reductase [Desulfobacterales bacterium]|nr:3-oxoacyl-ACP reductase [Desulfobacterales bacterium]MBF0395219.1 3-oxoacyl-ACP reductase [Desulfobacterales bacterium]
MTDFLVEIGKNDIAKKLIKSMGIPLSLPKDLKRDKMEWQEHPILDLPVIFGSIKGSDLTIPVAQSFARMGANTWVFQNEKIFQTFVNQGSPWGRTPEILDDKIIAKIKPHAIVFDATEINALDDLSLVHEFFHKLIPKLNNCGRAIILARKPMEIYDPIKAGAIHALEGFMRSMGREIGKNGSTTQLIYVDKGSENRLEPVLRFFMSYRSSYISGQSLHVTSKVITDNSPSFIRPIDGKVALVTGAARGIGAEISKSLSREGANVICMDLGGEGEHLSKLSDELCATPLICDITDKNSHNIILDFILKRFDGIDIIIHNAGITRDKTLAKMDKSLWDKTLDVNLISLVRINEALKPHIKKDGRIICMSSVTGIAGNIGQTNYSTSKAGIIGYVKALSLDLREKGVSVNAIAPGFIETQMTAKIPFMTREAARRLCNLSQGGLPYDVAELVTFLSSPGAYGITGEVIRVCGGSFIGA